MRTEQTNKQNLFSKIQMASICRTHWLSPPLLLQVIWTVFAFPFLSLLSLLGILVPLLSVPSALTPWSSLRNILSPSLQFPWSVPFCAMIFSQWAYAAPTPTRMGHSISYLTRFLRFWKDMNKIEFILLLPPLIPWLPTALSLSNSALKYPHLPSHWKPSLLLVSMLFTLKMRSVCPCLYGLTYQTPSSFTSTAGIPSSHEEGSASLYNLPLCLFINLLRAFQVSFSM